MSVNKVILLGRVGKQPEIKQVGDNKVANFSLATSEKFKDKNGNKVENTEWHNVVFWGKQADLIEQYVGKGDELYIEGSIKTETYEKDGEKRYATKIKGSAITFVSRAKKRRRNATCTRRTIDKTVRRTCFFHARYGQSTFLMKYNSWKTR